MSVTRRLRDERGHTMVELLAAMAIGVVVLLAAFMVLDRSFRVSKEAQDRAEAGQRGRLALEHVTRALRSQVCLAPTRAAITQADSNSLTVLVDLSDGSANPERRQFSYDPATRRITELTWASAGTFPTYTFPGYPSSPTRTRTLLTNAVPADATPVFRYYALDAAGGQGANVLLPTPLSGADMARTARIAVAFKSRPERATTNARSTELQDDVYMRSADPLNPAGGMSCL